MERTQRQVVANKLIAASRARGVSTHALMQALELMRLGTVPDGERLYREGDRSEDLHVLLEGSVRVLVGSDETELTRLRAPAILGHLGVLTGLPRSATVAAVGEVHVARMAYRELWDLLRSGTPPGVALRRLLLASMGQLIGQTNARLVELVPEHGENIPKDAPRITPPPRAAQRPGRKKGADDLTRGFDPDLLAQADEIRIVHSEADERQKYKG